MMFGKIFARNRGASKHRRPESACMDIHGGQHSPQQHHRSSRHRVPNGQGFMYVWIRGSSRVKRTKDLSHVELVRGRIKIVPDPRA